MAAGAESTGLATSGESHGLTVAPNGWVLYIGRGDCRTDAERGALLGGAPFGRIFDHANPDVGIGCGSVHVYDPAASNGTPNSGITRAGTLAVYGDGGQGGERTDEGDHKMEYGLLGVTTAPDFLETGHIYLQYFPSFDPESTPPGLPLERRVSKMSQPRISRFTMDLETKQIDLDSEVVVFQYDAQIYSCCHVGGGMGFDSAGNLYFTTGDTNSSQGSDGYSGNNPAAKCPTGPDDQPSSAHCGSAHYSYQDARRTAGNTNDYNGKMLRIAPRDLPEGSDAAPGVGSTYDVPGADAPNGPNLFDGSEGNARPEIYAMGLRNPSRLSIDPETDVPYAAWVGPDAGEPDADQGPSTYENAAQISHAGNYGWPYCMGDGQAYRDRIGSATAPDDPDATTLRGDNPPGYVPGGPGGNTPGFYDCDNLRNDSPNNTGLVEFPHETGTGMDAGTQRHTNLWWSRGNPDGRDGCPEFPREGAATNAPNYGATPTELCPYVINEGLTVMNGPVYRYDETATDNARRWPEYWDGRWFVHNSGGPSVKHALLLDPDTDQDGGRPIYADSLRGALDWDAAYMDSKFGPDGALYVQVYDGFFRAGPNAGIWRFDYVGGPATPGSAPRAFPIGDFEVAFEKGALGRRVLRVDVRRRRDLDRAGPDAPVRDGGLAHRRADRHLRRRQHGHRQRQVRRHRRARRHGAGDDRDDHAGRPERDQAGHRHAERHGRRHRRRAHRVPHQRRRVAGVQRAVQALRAGRVPDRVPVGRPGEQHGDREAAHVHHLGDPELHAGPQRRVRRRRAQRRLGRPEPRPGRARGRRRPARAGHPRGRPVRGPGDGEERAPQGRAGRPVGGHDPARRARAHQAGQQAGLVLWSDDDPNTFAKIVFINKGADGRRFEYVATRDDEADIQAGPTLAGTPREVYLRVRADGGGRYIPEYSLDGEEWELISQPIEDLGAPDDLRFGLKQSAGADADTRGAVPVLPRRLLGPHRAHLGGVGQPRRGPTASTAGTRPRRRSPSRVTTARARSPSSSTRSTAARGRPTPGRSRSARRASTRCEYFATDNAAEPNVEAPNDARRPRRRGGAEDGRRPGPVRGPGRPGAGDARPAGRRGRLRRGAHAVPRGRRAVADVLRRGGRAAVRRQPGLAERMGAGRRAAASSCSTTAPAGSGRSAGSGCSGTRPRRSATSS